MKKISIYGVLLVLISAVWFVSINFFVDRSSGDLAGPIVESVFVATDSLFSALMLMTMVYWLVLLSLEVRANRQSTQAIAHSNKHYLEITALTALIQECDTTLYRYDRWEKAGIKGDYMEAKTSVRDKMNA
ncbi:hypothetical protein MNBD_GAMMA10-1026, partial [hydrothermal vent metagenome]